MNIRTYQKVKLTKKQSEVVLFLETGSNNFWDAYYNYENRKQRYNRPTLTISSWFNKVVRSLHDAGIFKEIPFVLRHPNGFIWQNPGINATKANFECFTLHDAVMEQRAEMNKII